MVGAKGVVVGREGKKEERKGKADNYEKGKER